MGMFFRARMGTWTVSSESDPRWNASGRAEGAVFSGGPAEIEEHIRKMESVLGEPPKDLTVSFIKD